MIFCLWHNGVRVLGTYFNIAEHWSEQNIVDLITYDWYTQVHIILRVTLLIALLIIAIRTYRTALNET